MRTSHPSRRAGVTLVELAVVVTILGLVALVGVRQLQRHLDRLAVRNAAAEAATLVARSRDEALARRSIVTLRIDTAVATLLLRAGGEALARHPLGRTHGVSLSSSRDSIAFDARGFGYGAANVTLVVRRRSAADTLVISRLGRVRY